MHNSIRRVCRVGSIALLAMLIFAFCTNPTSARTSHISTVSSSFSASAPTASVGKTRGWAKVRSHPNTNSRVVTVYAPNTRVTIYSSISGQAVGSGNSIWYRVSSPSSSPLYIYSGFITKGTSSSSNITSNKSSPAPTNAQGKVIVVSIGQQWMHVYDNGREVYNAPITTGQAALPTPTGTYHVFAKLSPTTFYSPFRYGSPYWYAPTHINYALEWRASYFLHDSYWRSVYGPGMNVWHKDPVDGWETGTHGCIAMPLSAARWLYGWAPIGTTVQVNR